MADSCDIREISTSKGLITVKSNLGNRVVKKWDLVSPNEIFGIYNIKVILLLIEIFGIF